MPDRNRPVLDFLATRRSTPPKLLTAPAPDRAELTELLTLAARVPDHGMLTPWRFLVLDAAALRHLGAEIARIGAAEGLESERVAKAGAIYATSPLAVAVICAPKASEKAPEIEQSLSAGAVCLELLHAAHAAGWSAGWVTGWAAHDRRFLPALLDLAETESIAGLIHIGTGPIPADRPRPDVAALTSWRRE
ncbi:nitroreductase family protein [Frigidibacter sp. ROC022]|uniref:nitroreductase family protein n=1 Tax=Frigidibacter sp. ROC022 TaxID=2971796 RepID=UPI00215B2034|nr:nitroreductase [Frigidibacter sp. ROC022]MCR8726230.1 nitroreductase [Frigidibacter sp. ROC022]